MSMSRQIQEQESDAKMNDKATQTEETGIQSINPDGNRTNCDHKAVTEQPKHEEVEMLQSDFEENANWTLVNKGAEIKAHILNHGLKNINGVLRKQLDAWKKTPLNVALTGMSGKGKSTLINALRNIKAGDQGAAAVGVRNDITTACTRYPHPKHNNIVFWDVPGVGSTKFPQKSYLKDIDLDRYDFFLIVSTERISELDKWLGQEIRKRNKNFYYVRNKIDLDMESIQYDRPGGFDEHHEFSALKKDIGKQLVKDFGLNEVPLFLISGRFPEKYDFALLLRQLLTDAPEEKKMAMVFGIAGLSREIIEEKAVALASRTWICAIVSGAAAAIPVPGVSTAVDLAVILEEVLFYRQQFALDDDSLKQLADMAKVSLDELKKNINFLTPSYLFTEGGLAIYLAKYTVGEVVEKVVQYTIPVIGTSIACGISFATTIKALKGIMKTMKEDAINVLVYVTKKETAV